MGQVTAEPVTLEWLRMASQMHVPALFPGAHRPTVEVLDTEVLGGLVARLNAQVLSESGGPQVTRTVSASLPVRPWWLPAALWRRIPTRPARWTLTVRPAWIYPKANVALPDLGPAVAHALVFPPITEDRS